MLENSQTREAAAENLGEEFKLVRYCEIVFHPNGRLGGGCYGDVFIAVVPGKIYIFLSLSLKLTHSYFSFIKGYQGE